VTLKDLGPELAVLFLPPKPGETKWERVIVRNPYAGKDRYK